MTLRWIIHIVPKLKWVYKANGNFYKVYDIILCNHYPSITAFQPFSLILSRKLIPELFLLTNSTADYSCGAAGLQAAHRQHGLCGTFSRPLQEPTAPNCHGCNSQSGKPGQNSHPANQNTTEQRKQGSCAIFLLCLQKYHAIRFSEK